MTEKLFTGTLNNNKTKQTKQFLWNQIKQYSFWKFQVFFLKCNANQRVLMEILGGVPRYKGVLEVYA